MNTTRLKRFATEARNKIKQGVVLMMRQWGFDADGRVLEEPELLQGGTLFRGEVIGNEDVYHRWCVLRQSIETNGLRQVYEETAYTWFNRFIAIKILSKNSLLDPYLDYTASEGVRTTEIVAQARRGILPQHSYPCQLLRAHQRLYGAIAATHRADAGRLPRYAQRRQLYLRR